MIQLIGREISRRRHKNDNFDIEEIVVYEKNNLVGKYLIFNVDLSFIREISVSEEGYDTFETKYVEDFYYSLSGDERWNLYVIFVLEDSKYQEMQWSDKVFLERQRNYARKLIISYTEYERVFEGKSKSELHTSMISNVEDPISDWIKILSNNGMLFCKNEYKSKIFNSFVDGDKFSLSNKRIDNKVDVRTKNSYSNLKISSIDFGTNYRKHCFLPSTKMNFSHVNLIVGPNGSGKTSILEAIELGLTGAVYREFFLVS